MRRGGRPRRLGARKREEGVERRGRRGVGGVDHTVGVVPVAVEVAARGLRTVPPPGATAATVVAIPPRPTRAIADVADHVVLEEEEEGGEGAIPADFIKGL